MLIKVPLSFEGIPNRTAEIGYQGQPATRMVKLVQKPTEVVAVA